MDISTGIPTHRIFHAGFPFFLGMDIPKDDPDLQKFDFVSMALTSRDNMTDEVTLFPFSAMVIDSYKNLIEDIVLFLSSMVNSRLMTIERKISGVLPSSMDHFTKFYKPRD